MRALSTILLFDIQNSIPKYLTLKWIISNQKRLRLCSVDFLWVLQKRFWCFGKNVKLIILMENFLSEIWQKNLACLYCSGFITGLHALVRRTKNVNTMHKQWVHKKSQRRVKTFDINQHSKVLTQTVIQNLPTKVKLINWKF